MYWTSIKTKINLTFVYKKIKFWLVGSQPVGEFFLVEGMSKFDAYVGTTPSKENLVISYRETKKKNHFYNLENFKN